MPFIILSADDPVLLDLSQQMAVHYKEEFVRLTGPDCFKNFTQEKLRVTFTGHATTRSYGEELLTPREFYNKLKELKFPFDRVSQIDLDGCEIGLRKEGESTYLHEFARCMYADANTRHITLKGFTDLALPEDVNLGAMFVRADPAKSLITGVKKENMHAYTSDRKTEKNNDQKLYYITEHEDDLIDHNMGLREALDSNDNYAITFDIYQKLNSFQQRSQYRLACWAEVNNTIAHVKQTMPPSDLKNQILTILGTAKKNIEDVKTELSTAIEPLLAEKKDSDVYIDSKIERLKRIHDSLKKNQTVIDKLNSDTKEYNTSLLAGVSSEKPSILFMRLLNSHKSHPQKIEIAEALIENMKLAEKNLDINSMLNDAASVSDNDVISILLKEKVNPLLRWDNNPRSPLELAILEKNWEGISLMLSMSSGFVNVDSSSRDAILEHQDLIIKKFRERGNNHLHPDRALPLAKALEELKYLKTADEKNDKSAGSVKKDEKPKRSIDPSRKPELLRLAIKAELEDKIQMLYDENSLEDFVLQRDEKAVSLLLKAGADPNRPPTLLYDAVNSEVGQVIVKSLLDHKASLNSSRDGFNLLQAAIARKDEKVISLLLTSGADPNIPPHLLYTAILNEAGAPIIKLLLDHKASLDYSEDGFNILQTAVFKQDEKTVSVILAAGANPNLPRSMLYDAVKWNAPVSVLSLLLDKKADPNSSKDGETALAACINDEAKVALLLKAGAIPPPMLFFEVAEESMDSPVIPLLLEKTRNIDVEKDGANLLQNAIIASKHDLVDSLLKYGADPLYTSKESFCSPLSFALDLKDWKVAAKLLLKIPDPTHIPKSERQKILGIPALLIGAYNDLHPSPPSPAMFKGLPNRMEEILKKLTDLELTLSLKPTLDGK